VIVGTNSSPRQAARPRGRRKPRRAEFSFMGASVSIAVAAYRGGSAVKATIGVELDGCSFALDEAAFAALRAYLDRAAERLGDHPDRTDVLLGLERSIANKLGRNRGTQSAIDERELHLALAAVGRVDGPTLVNRSDGDQADPHGAGRRLYRLRDGQKIAGVCTGLAAFANIDVSLVRLGFVLGAMFSGGALIVAYVVLVFVMPIATTPEEIAAAYSGPSAARSR